MMQWRRLAFTLSALPYGIMGNGWVTSSSVSGPSWSRSPTARIHKYRHLNVRGGEQDEKQGDAGENEGDKEVSETEAVEATQSPADEAAKIADVIVEVESSESSADDDVEEDIAVVALDDLSIATDVSVIEAPTPNTAEDDFEDDDGSETEAGVDVVLSDEMEVRADASEKRRKGKEAHDEGQFETAASSFEAAADLLRPLIEVSTEACEEYATCRLHQALCHLKSDQNEAAKKACTQVLEECDDVAPALRARAFHRRAKAELELGDDAIALQDARSSAFLGDRKAVALYGKLMRESSPGASSSPADMFLGGPPGGPDMPSNPLMDSLLGKSTGSPLGGDSAFPSSLLSSALGATGTGGGAGGLAKSVFSSLSKKLDDEDTQQQICNFLGNTSGPQLQQMAGMAGIQIQTDQAGKLASFCKGVTPKMIRRTVKTSKRVIYAVQLTRKTGKLISKYRNIIILLILIGWIKSAILRPTPLNKKAIRRAAKEAAKAAAKTATIKATEAM